MTPVGLILTFVLWCNFVFFRASSVTAAISVLRGMAGLNGATIPSAIGSRLGVFGQWLEGVGVTYDWSSGSQLITISVLLGLLFVIVTALPNSLEFWNPIDPPSTFRCRNLT